MVNKILLVFSYVAVIIIFFICWGIGFIATGAWPKGWW